MRRSSPSSPLTSVPLPGSIETRASGATSQSSDARSILPRRPRTDDGFAWSDVSIFMTSSSASSDASTGISGTAGASSDGGGALVRSTCTPVLSRSAAFAASWVRSQPSSCRVSRPFVDTTLECHDFFALRHAKFENAPYLW